MSTHREQLAWAAGLFDGEGHISCRDRTGGGHLVKYKSPRSIVITISQHHTAVLERFQEAVGLGKIYVVTRSRPSGELYKSYSWRTGKFERVQAVTVMMWPWLGEVKRAQAIKAFKIYHLIGDRIDSEKESA